MYITAICPTCGNKLTEDELFNAGSLNLHGAAARGIDCTDCTAEIAVKRSAIDAKAATDLETFKSDLKVSKQVKPTK